MLNSPAPFFFSPPPSLPRRGPIKVLSLFTFMKYKEKYLI
jgi:hypothetical protein